MKKVSRSLHLIGATGATRTETYRSREYLVVPVVALVEGVIWPVNAESPEYVPPYAYSTAPEAWNGRPVFAGHPIRGGTQVLGNTPEILESEQWGQVFNAGVVNDKLAMEAWLNQDDAKDVGDHAVEIYDRAAAGKSIEISVGATVLMEEVTGTYNDQDYNGKWVEIFPDHLALLEKGDIGACSNLMGCGVRTATVHLVTAKGYELVKVKEDIVVPEKKTAKKTLKSSIKERFGAFLRMLSPAGRSDTEVRSELREALEEKEPRLSMYGWIVDVYENEGLVVYCMYDEDYDMDLYVRDFKWDGKTAIIGDLYAEVEAHTVYEIEDDENQANEVLITQLRAAQKNAQPKAASGSCGCGGKKTTTASETAAAQGDKGMKTKDERIAALIAASGGKLTDASKTWLSAIPEDQLENIEAGYKVPATTEPPARPAATTGSAVVVRSRCTHLPLPSGS